MNALQKAHPDAMPQPGIVRTYTFLEPGPRFLEDVLAGLRAQRKSLPFRWRYDHGGQEAALAWAEAAENHLQREERRLLQAHLGEAAVIIGPDVELMEMGPACGLQTRLLIDVLHPPLYVHIGTDPVSAQATAARIAAASPHLHIAGLIANPLKPLVPPRFAGVLLRKRALYLSALALGTYIPDDLGLLLRHARGLLGTGGALIASLDLKKGRQILDAAANDAQGLAARWNAALLQRINAELKADFQLPRFRHVGIHNEKLGCTGYYLESAYAQIVHVNGERFEFAEGEAMLSGLASQYSVQDFEIMAVEAGFKLQKAWADDARRVAVCLLMAV